MKVSRLLGGEVVVGGGEQCVVFSPKQINRGPSPHLGTAMQTPFPRYRLVKVS